MTPPSPGLDLLSCGRPLQRHVKSVRWSASFPHPSIRHASSAASPPPKKRTWLRIAVATVAAGAIGAYVRSQQDSKSATLNSFKFAHYELVSREPVSSTSSIFTLRPTKPGQNKEVYEAAWKTGVWSITFKQPQLQIGRDYTPLPPVQRAPGDAEGQSEDDESLRFLIRRDPYGEMSRYLHTLNLGTKIEIRGPQIECAIPADVRDILFIAGGTGIAPALQSAYTLLRRTGDGNKPRIHILWANRRRDDCLGGLNDSLADASAASWWSKLFGSKNNTPQSVAAPGDLATGLIVKELEALKAQYPGQITVDYFVDEEKTFISKKSILDFTDSTSSPSDSTRGGKMILVSGPEGFINYMAGPKVWAQGMELQGPLEGIIKELDLKGWDVWKL